MLGPPSGDHAPAQDRSIVPVDSGFFQSHFGVFVASCHLVQKLNRHETALASLSPSGLPFVPAHMFADWAALTEEKEDHKPQEEVSRIPSSLLVGSQCALRHLVVLVVSRTSADSIPST